MAGEHNPGRAPEDQRVDELRQQLRALGYLDAGVDRFVLAPASTSRRPAVIAALSAVRAGLLSGALLGPAVAIGIGSRLPGLITGPQDAIVVAVYVAVLAAAAFAAAAFLASLAAAALPQPSGTRHARLISRIAGTVVGGASLIYLTLWWRITNAEAAAAAPVWTMFALAVAVAISLLLGHATAVTVVAVRVASGGSLEQSSERPGSAFRLTAVAAILAFAGASALLLATSRRPSSGSAPPPLPVVSPGVKVTVIGIDGFDEAIARTQPHLAQLLSVGGIRIEPAETGDPARAWTTIATGQPPDVHGIRGLQTTRVAGLEGAFPAGDGVGMGRAIRGATDLLRLTRPSIASGTELRVKPLWEIAADAGLRAAVVNWWATWPAAADGPHAPIVLSDRATLRLEHGGALDAEIAPSSLYARLRNEWPRIKAEAERLVSTHLPSIPDAGIASGLRRAAEVDALQLSLVSRLDRGSLDLLAIYLPGLDIAQRTLLEARGVAELSARLDAIRGYYIYLDRILQELGGPGRGELIILVAQPGRGASTEGGLMVLSGRVANGTAEGTARAVDIAPTILHALGIPISRQLPGAPVVAAYTGAFAERFPVRHVDSYGQRTSASAVRSGQPLDQEMIERLRSLGYVR